MSKYPLVTVGMPVRNGANTLRRSLDSLVQSDYPNLEILISDNASTDDTPNICRDYMTRYAIISYSRNETNVGITANFQKVLSKAKGCYFAWAAADDWWAPDFVSRLVGELELYPDAVLAMCATERVSPQGLVFDTIRFTGDDSPARKGHLKMALSILGYPKVLKENFYCLGLHRTKVLQQAFSLYTDIPGLDRLLLVQLALAGRFRYVDHILLRKTIHDRSQRQRRPNEVYNILRGERGILRKKNTVLAGAILRSPVVPWWRKAYTPIILGAVLRRQLWPTVLRLFVIPVWSMIKPYLPVGVVKFLRSCLRFLLPKKPLRYRPGGGTRHWRNRGVNE
ncbi:MAG: glycosyltransferase [Gammaproteobacteria bacterium]|nr:glycosyltransferase [Gammaproteobacteria bacterium]